MEPAQIAGQQTEAMERDENDHNCTLHCQISQSILRHRSQRTTPRHLLPTVRLETLEGDETLLRRSTDRTGPFDALMQQLSGGRNARVIRGTSLILKAGLWTMRTMCPAVNPARFGSNSAAIEFIFIGCGFLFIPFTPVRAPLSKPLW
jgi:hypothetical protein